MRSTRIKRLRPSAARTTLGKRQLEELIEEAIVDAYGESEQRVGFLSMLQIKLACPFETEILGAPAVVEGVDLNDAEDIVAIAAEASTNRSSRFLICRCHHHDRSVGNGLRP